MNHTKRYIHKQHKDTNIIYIIKQDNCIYIYMLRIAGQTAGPIGLKFFVDTHGCPPPGPGKKILLQLHELLESMS